MNRHALHLALAMTAVGCSVDSDKDDEEVVVSEAELALNA